MTAGIIDGLLIVRACVLSGGRQRAAYLQVTGSSGWSGLHVGMRKRAVREVKTMLLMQGALCRTCADGQDAVPPPCTLCNPLALELCDGRGEYPITGDMLWVYPPAARFSLIAYLPPAEPQPDRLVLARTTQYAGLELRAPEWVDASPADRHRHMRKVVEHLVRDYPAVEHSKVRTLIFDGTREIPYPFNWRDVLDDQDR
ncbi:hypothetical protein AB0G49_13790 [Streptomyces longwoodensis]|uniref:hypothetical protein n=1 Tax=Streptomyces longwoodensis TaxID=68231 RepID=UPI0033FBD464